ncbi:hypothetical protein PPACK8108_LOCUS26451 [Phakopsora pachyrhizi]|uniref:Uncharacterized protein n=1 Tax=Phakopsora pachyrhizi TaxID=170000 RepID=A0AAV0BXB6_PHAPC|nr:hypothetical protein PPACK8108_LOCUS26451 [Phakopsora pachyrhizi]
MKWSVLMIGVNFDTRMFQRLIDVIEAQRQNGGILLERYVRLVDDCELLVRVVRFKDEREKLVKVRNTQAGKSAGVAGWLKMPLFGYAIANHLRRPLYYFSLYSMHTYLPTSSSYSGYPPFCMAFVNSNHYVVLHFKKVNDSIPAPPIDGWWPSKSSLRNKNMWLQSLENDLSCFKN